MSPVITTVIQSKLLRNNTRSLG